MPKDHIDRAIKRQNRTGLVEAIDVLDITDVAPEYRKVRWGYAVSELEGRCFSHASFGGGWPLTMGFRKHLYTRHGFCRRCSRYRHDVPIGGLWSILNENPEREMRGWAVRTPKGTAGIDKVVRTDTRSWAIHVHGYGGRHSFDGDAVFRAEEVYQIA